MGDAATPARKDPTRAFYDRISRAYDLIADSSEHRSREAGLELLDVAPGESALELGCGTGHALVALAQAVGEHGVVAGVDLSTGMLRQSRKRVLSAGLAERVTLVHGDARRLPFSAGSFDAAFLSFTVELFGEPDIPLVLSELRRVLRAEGRLGVVSMWHTEPHGRIVTLYEWLHRHFPHVVDCQPIPLPTLLAGSDFEITRRQELSIATLPVLAAVARPAATHSLG